MLHEVVGGPGAVDPDDQPGPEPPFAWTKTAEEILNSLAGYLSKISGGAH